MTARRVAIYAEFLIILGAILSVLFLRWHVSFVLSPYLVPAFASCVLALVLDGDTKKRKTTYQQTWQLIISLLSAVCAGLLLLQIGIVIHFQGAIPNDPTPLSQLAYTNDFEVLVAELVLGILVALVESLRLVIYASHNQCGLACGPV